MRSIRKAVFPVAGMGTRFLPATKAMPKEMLPIVDKPLIQYAVEEAAAAGITDMIFVTGRNKRAIEDHFDRMHELESELAAHGKDELLEQLRELVPPELRFAYVRQGDPRGLGHAVGCAAPLIEDEPFAVILADDLMDSRVPAMTQMVGLFEQHQQPVLAVQSVARAETNRYGIVAPVGISAGLHRVASIVEKPAPKDAPSTLGVIGRYILTPDIFECLSTIDPGAGGELQLTDAIALLLKRRPVLAYEVEGRRYDCGNKLGYMQAMVDFGVRHPVIGAAFKSFLDKRPAVAAVNEEAIALSA